MKGFYSVIDAVVKGYTVSPAEMKYTPTGKAVANVRVGCGGSEKRPGTFVDIVAWGPVAEKLNELALSKGLAIRAAGIISQRRWTYQDKRYERIECIYLTELSVQVGDVLEVVEVPLKGDNGGGGATASLDKGGSGEAEAEAAENTPVAAGKSTKS